MPDETRNIALLNVLVTPKDANRIAAKARQHALNKLAVMHPDDFYELLATERAAVGLEAKVTRRIGKRSAA